MKHASLNSMSGSKTDSSTGGEGEGRRKAKAVMEEPPVFYTSQMLSLLFL